MYFCEIRFKVRKYRYVTGGLLHGIEIINNRKVLNIEHFSGEIIINKLGAVGHNLLIQVLGIQNTRKSPLFQIIS